MVVEKIPLVEILHGENSPQSLFLSDGLKTFPIWLTEGAIDLQPFFTDTVLKKERASAVFFMTGSLFSPHPPRSRWPDRYCRDKSNFRGEDKAGWRYERRSNCPSAWMVTKEILARMEVGKFKKIGFLEITTRQFMVLNLTEFKLVWHI